MSSLACFINNCVLCKVNNFLGKIDEKLHLFDKNSNYSLFFLVNHLNFPNFATNQIYNGMRIKTFDQNGRLISEKEVKCRIPKCVQEFDDSHPLVHIGSKEHKLLNSKSESIEKLLLIEKYRQILRYDYSLFLDSSDGCYILSILSDGVFGISKGFNAPSVEIKGIISKKDWLKYLIAYIKETAEEKYSNPENIEIWLNYIKSESEDSWSTYYNKVALENNCKYDDRDELCGGLYTCAKRYRTLLDTLQKEMYPQLKRKSKQSKRFKNILCLIPTRYSSQLEPYSFDDDNFVVKLCNSLYEIKSKKRSDVYGTLLIYDFMTQTLKDQTLEFMSFESEDYVFTIDAKGDCKIEIASSPQENSFLKISNHPKKNILSYKKWLNIMYDDYVAKKSEDIIKYTEELFPTYNIKYNQWKELRSKLREEMERGKYSLGRNRPESYYYLLILKYDNEDNLIEFNDEFIKDLLVINDKFHSITLTDIFDYICQFNYIKSKYNSKQEESRTTIINDMFVPEKKDEYTDEEIINTIISFISPILNENYIENKRSNGKYVLVMELETIKDNFRTLFDNIECKNKEISNKLMSLIKTKHTDSCPFYGFNYRVLLNIIGALKTGKDGKSIEIAYVRIFKDKATSIVNCLFNENRGFKKNDRGKVIGTTSFHNYIRLYYDHVNTLSDSYSLLNQDMIRYIQELFSVGCFTNTTKKIDKEFSK